MKDDNSVFDTTLKEVAIASNLNKEADYKPVIICVGEGLLLPAIEEGLIGKNFGKFSFELQPDEAFGRKSGKLLKLVPIRVFKQQDIMPYPGLDVNIDGQYGIIRNVSGGRVIVDFNHPLSGRELSYKVEVKRFITNDKEKLDSILTGLGVPYNSCSVKEKNAMIVLNQDMPVDYKKLIDEKAKELVGINKVSYITKKKEEKPTSEQQK